MTPLRGLEDARTREGHDLAGELAEATRSGGHQDLAGKLDPGYQRLDQGGIAIGVGESPSARPGTHDQDEHGHRRRRGASAIVRGADRTHRRAAPGDRPRPCADRTRTARRSMAPDIPAARGPRSSPTTRRPRPRAGRPGARIASTGPGISPEVAASTSRRISTCRRQDGHSSMILFRPSGMIGMKTISLDSNAGSCVSMPMHEREKNEEPGPVPSEAERRPDRHPRHPGRRPRRRVWSGRPQSLKPHINQPERPVYGERIERSQPRALSEPQGDTSLAYQAIGVQERTLRVVAFAPGVPRIRGRGDPGLTVRLVAARPRRPARSQGGITGIPAKWSFLMPTRLLALDGSPDIALDHSTVLVGRHPRCDVRIDSVVVSRRHCCVSESGGEARIRDLGSTNGIRVNGRRVDASLLRPGDEVTIAHLRYIVDSRETNHRRAEADAPHPSSGEAPRCSPPER